MSLNIVKAKIIESGKTMSQVVAESTLGSLPNFSQKLSRGTLKYTEAEEVADICGYEIVWEKKDKTSP
ncbi:MAG: hypothetical protein ACRC76_14620 [Proteocatella sp.]